MSDVFGHVADDYAAARPGYPRALFDALWTRLPPARGRPWLLLDVAAGAGAATAPLVEGGARVVAVEPSIGMLRHARNRLGREPGWLSGVAGRGEALPVSGGAIDGIVVAQAFHWLDERLSLAEFARVLRTGGLLAILWNIVDVDDLVSEVWRLVERMNPGHKRPVTAERRSTPAILASDSDFLTEPPLEFAHARHLTEDEYVRYAFSWSYVGGALGAAERVVFERELRAIWRRHLGSGVREERFISVAHFARRR